MNDDRMFYSDVYVQNGKIAYVIHTKLHYLILTPCNVST